MSRGHEEQKETSMEISELDLSRARQMVEHMETDEELIAKMEKSDEVSQQEGQVAHGWVHAQDVRALTLHVAHETNRLIAGTFNEFDLPVAIASALLHDSGRSVSVKDHEKHGAVIAHKYLKGVAKKLFGSEDACPKVFRIRVVQNVCKHRSNSWLYKDETEKGFRRKELKDPAQSALLLGDKLCGSESRVPEEKLALMLKLVAVRLPRGFRKKHGLPRKWTPARINWNHTKLADSDKEVALVTELRTILADRGIEIPDDLHIDAHDRVNGAIKTRAIEMTLDTEPAPGKIKGSLVYHIKVDERIAPQDLVVYMDWWGDAFHTSAKAAKHLGFRFQIEFNGHTLCWDRAQKLWVSSMSFPA
jgi:hypothetical protein